MPSLTQTDRQTDRRYIVRLPETIVSGSLTIYSGGSYWLRYLSEQGGGGVGPGMVPPAQRLSAGAPRSVPLPGRVSAH